jgi:NAD-reducing hydrogenase large subunit
VWANLIVATGHNKLAINHSVGQVARHFIHGNQMKEGMLNRVSAVGRAYDPCLSCSTHADGTLALDLKGPSGEVLNRLTYRYSVDWNEGRRYSEAQEGP